MRERWTLAGAIGLSIILAMACLNEIVSAFLVAIPIVDAVARRGVEARREQWIVAHAMVVPIVWFFLEVFVNGRLIPESAVAEGQSHFNMLLYYLAKNDYGLASIYSFVLNWFLFNIAAPTPTAPLWAQFGGYFAPTFTSYFRALPTIGVIGSLTVITVASVLPRYRTRDLGPAGALLLAVAAFGLVRAAFFFFFNPAEPMLFSPAVTLPHWLILLVPFAASRFPAKGTVLAVLAICLIATNAGLILGHDVWALALRCSPAFCPDPRPCPAARRHLRSQCTIAVNATDSDRQRCGDQTLTRLLKAGRHALTRPEARFLVAGTIASLVNWLARFPLERAMPFAAAVLAAMVVGMVCGFLLYDRWVFAGSPRPLRSKIRDFVAVNVASQVMMFVVSIGARELLLLAEWGLTIAGAAAHLFGIACGALLSYFGHRSITFGARAK